MGWHAYCLSLLQRRLLGSARMLVVRRDSDWLERDLERRNVFERCDVIRVLSQRAKRKGASSPHGAGVTLLDLDSNALRLPHAMYDAIWCDMALGQVAEPDQLVEQLATALQPQGLFFAYEYVGPDRMAIGKAQRDAVQATFSLIPRRHRGSSEAQAEVPHEVALPPPGGVTDRDAPVSSSRVLRAIGKHLSIRQSKALGGTLLQFVLRDIAANFAGQNGQARGVLEMLFAIEDALVDGGELESDYALVVAAKRETPGRAAEIPVKI